MNDDPLLLAGFTGAATALDTQARAWVIVVGRLIELEPRGPFADDDIRRFMALAQENGDFPPGPLAYAAEHAETEVNDDYHMVTARGGFDGEPYLESKVALGTAGFVAEGFTRSGRLAEDEPVLPSHVLLADVESVLTSTILHLTRAATLLDYAGPGRVMAGVVSTVPGQPLTVRTLSEETGKLLPGGTEVDQFPHVTLDLDIWGSQSEAHRRCYDALDQLARRFDLTRPQFITDPSKHTEDYGAGRP